MHYGLIYRSLGQRCDELKQGGPALMLIFFKVSVIFTLRTEVAVCSLHCGRQGGGGWESEG